MSQDVNNDQTVIDEGYALSLLSGKTHIYLKLLERFTQTCEAGTYDVKRLYIENHIDDAGRTAHTMKGISLNVGAKHLNEVATKLDKFFKLQDNASIETTLPDYDEALSTREGWK